MKAEKLVAEDIGVDAGMIIVCDTQYLIDVNKKFGQRTKIDADLGREFKVQPGRYRVKCHIGDTWNGAIDEYGVVEIKSGALTVIDPCYVIQHESQKNWLDWLSMVEFGKNPPFGVMILTSMGGDGCYTVELTLERTKKAAQ